MSRPAARYTYDDIMSWLLDYGARVNHQALRVFVCRLRRAGVLPLADTQTFVNRHTGPRTFSRHDSQVIYGAWLLKAHGVHSAGAYRSLSRLLGRGHPEGLQGVQRLVQGLLSEAA